MNIHSALPPAPGHLHTHRLPDPCLWSCFLQTKCLHPAHRQRRRPLAPSTWETEPAHVLLPHSTQHKAAAQSPCLSPTLTPSPHPHQSSFLEGSQHHLFTAYLPANSISFLLQTPPSAANEPIPFHSAVTHCLLIPACEESQVSSSQLPHQDTAFHHRQEALQSAPPSFSLVPFHLAMTRGLFCLGVSCFHFFPHK